MHDAMAKHRKAPLSELLSRYARTDSDRAEILRAMRGMRDIAWRTFTPESVSAIVDA